MLQNLRLITVIVWFDSILTAEADSNSKCNQISFNLRVFGYLANMLSIIVLIYVLEIAAVLEWKFAKYLTDFTSVELAVSY